VEPGKLTHYPLWLPGECRLVRTTLAGTPVDPLPAPGGKQFVIRRHVRLCARAHH
jgi:hypothetical protein